jgi:hypothetical protein
MWEGEGGGDACQRSRGRGALARAASAPHARRALLGLPGARATREIPDPPQGRGVPLARASAGRRRSGEGRAGVAGAATGALPTPLLPPSPSKRDPGNDKGCEAPIWKDSGFCECDGGLTTRR